MTPNVHRSKPALARTVGLALAAAPRRVPLRVIRNGRGPLATRGQVRVDAQTYDVLRIDRGLPGPTDLRVPPRLQRRRNFGTYRVLDRDDVSMRFGPAAFTNPDEVLLLPEAIDSITVVRGGLQATRRTDVQWVPPIPDRRTDQGPVNKLRT
jgi:hypothetical protein